MLIFTGTDAETLTVCARVVNVTKSASEEERIFFQLEKGEEIGEIYRKLPNKFHKKIISGIYSTAV